MMPLKKSMEELVSPGVDWSQRYWASSSSLASWFWQRRGSKSRWAQFCPGSRLGVVEAVWAGVEVPSGFPPRKGGGGLRGGGGLSGGRPHCNTGHE